MNDDRTARSNGRAWVRIIAAFRRGPARNRILVDLARRVQRFSVRSAEFICQRCGGCGPVEGLAVLFPNAKERTQAGASVWCVGCVIEADRIPDAVRVTAIPGAASAAHVSIIDCGVPTQRE